MLRKLQGPSFVVERAVARCEFGRMIVIAEAIEPPAINFPNQQAAARLKFANISRGVCITPALPPWWFVTELSALILQKPRDKPPRAKLFFGMENRPLTLGHSPDPDDAFMFYALAKDLIPTRGWRFQHILQDIQTLNERATRGELDISAISIHAYAYVSEQYALLPSGASMGDGYGPMLVAGQRFTKAGVARRKIAVPGTMTSAFLALQLWLAKPARELDYVVVPFDQIFAAVQSGRAEIGLIIHEGQLTYRDQGLQLCEDLGVWWGRENGGLPLPLGGNVIHKRFEPATRKMISDILTASIQYSLSHRAEAVQYALPYARDIGRDLADRFVGMYVNHWTLDYGENGRESIRRFLGQAQERGLIPRRPELEFVS